MSAPVPVQVQCKRFHIKPYNQFIHVSVLVPVPVLETTSVIKSLHRGWQTSKKYCRRFTLPLHVKELQVGGLPVISRLLYIACRQQVERQYGIFSVWLRYFKFVTYSSDHEFSHVLPHEVRALLVHDRHGYTSLYTLVKEECSSAWHLFAVVHIGWNITETEKCTMNNLPLLGHSPTQNLQKPKCCHNILNNPGISH